jgi:hypothetical protein
MSPYDLTYLSLGAGVQSSALLVCSALGLHGVPKADVAIFADTQNEPPHVYEAVERLRQWAAPHGIPVEMVTAGDLLEDAKARIAGTRSRFASIPLFVAVSPPTVSAEPLDGLTEELSEIKRVAGEHGYDVTGAVELSSGRAYGDEASIEELRDMVKTHELAVARGVAEPPRTGAPVRSAPGRRQCTREYKIAPIEKRVRELLGYRPRQVVKKRALNLVGISVDELYRVKPSRTPWVVRAHPLVDARLTREACIRIVVEAGLPMPKKSACVFCPYTDNRRWQEMKRDDPASFEKACQADEALRDQSSSGMRGLSYVHRSLVPLRDIDFDKLVGDRYATPLLDFAEECEGMCGV